MKVYHGSYTRIETITSLHIILTEFLKRNENSEPKNDRMLES